MMPSSRRHPQECRDTMQSRLSNLDLLQELASAAEPFAWTRPYHVEDDEVVHLTVTGAQMKRLMAALDH